MTQEEKAKAYDEALERAKECHIDGLSLHQPVKDVIEHIFPELKESEDEKIRKAFIGMFKGYNIQKVGDFTDKEIIAWLEKQGKQKPSKDEPKFKVGDWILYSGDHYEGVRHITKINENGYYIERNGLPNGIIPFNHEICMRLWSIKDAKDGDVLKEDSCTFIIERMKSDGTAIIHCCLFDDGDFDLGSTLSFDVDSTYPATKEQQDLLFQKMKESGFEWDANKKELRKIEQKPSWSEEDSPYYDDICEILINLLHSETTKVNKDIIQKDLNWLVSIKNRVIPHPKQEWSEEDEYTLGETIQHLEELIRIDKAKHCSVDVQYYQRDIDWLKSLKQRIGE